MRKSKLFGRTAHAGLDPWLGRSALDALELFAHGINNMREHVEPTARIHYIFEATGVAVNVVPEYASLFIAFREADIPRVEALAQWAKEIADGAALMTQTTSKFNVYIGFAPLIPNDPLAARLLAHINAVGVDHWTAEEQLFAKQCQKAFNVAETGMAKNALPLLPDTPVGGGTDVGDVSWNVPTALFAWPTFPQGISLHTWPVTACGGMSIGDKASIASATILAATAFDLMTDPELLTTRVTPAEAPELARALRRLGPRSVVLKLGDEGSYYSSDAESFHTPAFPVEVRDTTAAGDTFNAALAVALAEGQATDRAVRFANAAAAISVTRLGAQASAPARAEVDLLLKAE